MTINGNALDRPLPSSESAESALLGGILLNNGLMPEVMAQIEPGAFYSPRNRRVFAGMISLFEKQKPIDPILIGEELKKDGSLESIGGVSTITDLSFGIPLQFNPAEYIKIIAAKQRARDLLRTCSLIQTQILDDADVDTGS